MGCIYKPLSGIKGSEIRGGGRSAKDENQANSKGEREAWRRKRRATYTRRQVPSSRSKSGFETPIRCNNAVVTRKRRMSEKGNNEDAFMSVHVSSCWSAAVSFRPAVGGRILWRRDLPLALPSRRHLPMRRSGRAASGIQRRMKMDWRLARRGSLPKRAAERVRPGFNNTARQSNSHSQQIKRQFSSFLSLSPASMRNKYFYMLARFLPVDSPFPAGSNKYLTADESKQSCASAGLPSASLTHSLTGSAHRHLLSLSLSLFPSSSSRSLLN